MEQQDHNFIWIGELDIYKEKLVSLTNENFPHECVEKSKK